jgi:hypothetical protein
VPVSKRPVLRFVLIVLFSHRTDSLSARICVQNDCRIVILHPNGNLAKHRLSRATAAMSGYSGQRRERAGSRSWVGLKRLMSDYICHYRDDRIHLALARKISLATRKRRIPVSGTMLCRWSSLAGCTIATTGRLIIFSDLSPQGWGKHGRSVLVEVLGPSLEAQRQAGHRLSLELSSCNIDRHLE